LVIEDWLDVPLPMVFVDLRLFLTKEITKKRFRLVVFICLTRLIETLEMLLGQTLLFKGVRPTTVPFGVA